VADVRKQPGRPESPHPKRHIYSLETTGLIIISVLILILTVIRYWRYIPWSAR
jgi:hypothetical protein